MKESNKCYTYFKITGKFKPDDISDILKLTPTKQWNIDDTRKNNTRYDFSLWEFGRCDTYDVFVEKQMMKTIKPLTSKINELCKIKEMYDAYFTLEIVPSLYVGEINPCLAPNKDVIKFCYETDTNIDIDLYLFDSTK